MSIQIQATQRELDARQSLPKGVPLDLTADHLGGLIVSELFGKYYNLCRAGMLFMAQSSQTMSSGAGAAFNFCWWNPASSGVLMVPIRWKQVYVSGTGVLSTFGWKTIDNAGDTVASSAGVEGTITAFTPLTFDGGGDVPSYVNMFRGGANIGSGASPGFPEEGLGRKSKIKVGSSATGTSQGVNSWNIAISQQAPVAAGTNIFTQMYEDFDGALILGPGTFTYPFSSAASGDTWFQTLIWAEVPL